MTNLKNLKFLLVGQLKTSRTETLEDYLKERAGHLAVIGFMSPFASYNEARCTSYDNNLKKKEFFLPSFIIKKVYSWNKPLMVFSFLLYVIIVFSSVRRLRQKFDVFIGVATFSSLLGIILKKMGYVQKVIYYCIDYYPRQKKVNFDSLINIIYRYIDAWLIKKADIIWEISPKIKKGRFRYAKIEPDSYQSLIVPLGYSSNIQRDCPFEQRERWTLGFIGTLSQNQGLQLVIQAMPELIKQFPEIKVKVIGHGPYFLPLKELAQRFKVEDRFIFHGFIKDEEKVYDILSTCMAGLATWTNEEDDNSLYADPGKPKLYALLGLPIIITRGPYVSDLIYKLKAGEVISYDINDFIAAVKQIFKSKENYLLYEKGLEEFRKYCLADKIFDETFKQIQIL
ncbi:MAG: glycosyltransferase [Candidatus Omnitrophica bacterium]|jgi:glycosyltransferase involved in cell wall biosynthesis|nr:glycosyltransferase [Candidatus Omnitrophota bacterium]